jgi:hypothetical protein
MLANPPEIIEAAWRTFNAHHFATKANIYADLDPVVVKVAICADCFTVLVLVAVDALPGWYCHACRRVCSYRQVRWRSRWEDYQLIQPVVVPASIGDIVSASVGRRL